MDPWVGIYRDPVSYSNVRDPIYILIDPDPNLSQVKNRFHETFFLGTGDI